MSFVQNFLRIALLIAPLIALPLSMLGLLGCTTTAAVDPRLELMPVSRYMDKLDEFSNRTQTYSGLFNTLDLHASILNNVVMRGQIDQMARIYLWEKEKYDEEMTKSQEILNQEARFFVSIYTPDRRYNDLYKSKNLWKIFLDVQGKRYEGTAKKIKMLGPEIQALYHYHSRFSAPYIVTFPVPMTAIQYSKSKLTFTGPIGAASVSFDEIRPE